MYCFSSADRCWPTFCCPVLSRRRELVGVGAVGHQILSSRMLAAALLLRGVLAGCFHTYSSAGSAVGSSAEAWWW